MSEVKRFTITGEIKKHKLHIPFSVDFNALTKEQALERLYADLGSRHRARRFEIKVKDVQEAVIKAEA